MLVRLAQASLASEASSDPPLTVPAAILGILITLVGLGLLFVNRRRATGDDAADHNWMYYTGGVATAAGLAVAAYGLLGLGS